MRNDLVFFKIKLPSIIKYFFIILFLLTSVTKLISQNINCDLMLNPEDLMIDGEGTIFPGDTICLLAGPKNYLFLKNIHGTEEEPVLLLSYPEMAWMLINMAFLFHE